MLFIYAAQCIRKGSKEMKIRWRQVWGIWGWGNTSLSSSWIAALVKLAMWGRALSCCRKTLFCRFGLFCWLASLSRYSYLTWSSALTVRLRSSNSWWSMPSQSKHTHNMVFRGWRSCFARGVAFCRDWAILYVASHWCISTSFHYQLRCGEESAPCDHVLSDVEHANWRQLWCVGFYSFRLNSVPSKRRVLEPYLLDEGDSPQFFYHYPSAPLIL